MLDNIIQYPSIERKRYRDLQNELDQLNNDIARAERSAKVAHLIAFITVLENTIISLKKVVVKFAEDYEKGEDTQEFE